MGRASDPVQRKHEERHEASLRAADRLLKKLATRVEQLDRWVEDPPDGETFITELRIKMQGTYDDQVLCVLKAHHGGTAKVAFHSGESVSEALTGIVARLANGTLVWKPDEYAGGPKGPIEGVPVG